MDPMSDTPRDLSKVMIQRVVASTIFFGFNDREDDRLATLCKNSSRTGMDPILAQQHKINDYWSHNK